MRTDDKEAPVSVLGASGYVGSRLVGELLRRGHRVRALARSPARLAGYPWAGHPKLEVAACDAQDAPSVRAALMGCRAAYYLIHHMQAGVKDFEAADRKAAQNFADAAHLTPGLRQILYLGGLGKGQPALSQHLRSRHEVERILASSGVPVTVLRAAMVIGAGSASFEILRYLTDRLPVMIAPRWLYVPCQPIFIADVVGYLAGCLGLAAALGQSFDVGGPEVVTYRTLIDRTAEASRLRRRRVLPVPVLTPRLSSYWIALVTPIPAAIARPLAEGLRNPVVCQDARIQGILPMVLTPIGQAIRMSVAARPGERAPVYAPQHGDARWAGGTVFIDHRERFVSEPLHCVWEAVAQVGRASGRRGANALWRRALPIEDARPPNLLRLRGEVMIPGQASLEFRLDGEGRGTRLTQQAEFRPRGLAGILYWQTMRPVHALFFSRLIGGVERLARSLSPPPGPHGAG